MLRGIFTFNLEAFELLLNWFVKMFFYNGSPLRDALPYVSGFLTVHGFHAGKITKN